MAMTTSAYAGSTVASLTFEFVASSDGHQAWIDIRFRLLIRTNVHA